VSEFVQQADIIVDAFDNFPLKLLLREEAKRQGVPVVSGFDIEKGVLLIVERYDLEPELDSNLFLNHHQPHELLQPPATPEAKTQLFIDIIGPEYHSPRMLNSVKSVGQTLTGYPQLIVATLLAASLFTATIEDILLERTKGSFRRYYSVNQAL
jgi:molybdopterin/thiamine biosynthesis adenylyltransferase